MKGKPNIIVFMTDHQRGDTILEKSPVKTPNLDRFRKRAVTFSQAYCPAPHCCPSRATFFSGLYPSEHGVWNNVNVSNTLSPGLYDGVRLFSQDLKEHGYGVYLSGKWHVSREQGPGEFGIQTIYHNGNYGRLPSGADIREWNTYFQEREAIDDGSEERRKGEIIRPGYPHSVMYGRDEHPFDDDIVVDEAVNRLSELYTEEEPFFLFTGPLGPHDPYLVPQRFLDMYAPEEIGLPESFADAMEDKPALYRRTKERFDQMTQEEQKECIRHFYAFCTYEDWLFGKILHEVERLGKQEETVIMYLSDHGDYVGAHGLWTKGLPCFREAYHVCAMIGGGTGFRQGRTEEKLVSLADLAPTVLELAGIPYEDRFSGKSLVPLLQGEPAEDWRQECYTQTNGNEVYGIQRAVWNSKWKYVFNTFDYDELYDLESDPHEMHNLLNGWRKPEESPYKETVKEMCAKMWEFAWKHKDNCVNPYITTAFAPFGPGIILEKLEGEK